MKRDDILAGVLGLWVGFSLMWISGENFDKRGAQTGAAVVVVLGIGGAFVSLWNLYKIKP